MNDIKLQTQSSAPATYLPKGEGLLTFPINRTVLLVIDPVNDFLSEGGAAYEMTKTTLALHNVIDNLRLAIEGARLAGVPVIFGPMAYTEEDYADEHLQHRCGINRMMFELKMFTAGSWGADFHPDLKPLENDIVLTPHKSTDVFETDLPKHLERLGTTHLIIAGMAANLCCESTGRRATEKGYDVTFLEDAIGSEDMLSYEAAVKINYPLIGNAVIRVNDLIAALSLKNTDNISIQPGDIVCGSDGSEIGKVSEIFEASESYLAHFVVPRGLVFEKDTYIPRDAVVKQTGKKIFVNIPKMVIGKMPWDAPPTSAGMEEKYGPHSSKVAKLYSSRNPTGID
ncbi:MAG: nicotinamidase-like amidase [Methylotenera sp.]|nr:MAG: nicotinamidase-like amidase [Methylotenera sp.]